MFLTLSDFYDRKSRCSGIVKSAVRTSANGKDRTCRFCGGGTNVMRWTAIVRPPPSLLPRVFIVDCRKRHRQPFFYSVSTSVFLSFFSQTIGPRVYLRQDRSVNYSELWSSRGPSGSQASRYRGVMFGFRKTQTTKWNNLVHTQTSPSTIWYDACFYAKKVSENISLINHYRSDTIVNLLKIVYLHENVVCVHIIL